MPNNNWFGYIRKETTEIKSCADFITTVLLANLPHWHAITVNNKDIVAH